MPSTAKKRSPKHEPPIPYVAGTDPLAVGPPALIHLPAELVGVQPAPPAYDPDTAEALLTAYLPRLKAIPPDRLDFPRVDVDAVSRTLLAVYAFTQVPQLRSLFEAAASAGQFDMVNLERLKEVTLVLIHTFRKAEAAGALKTSAKVPAELDAESLEVEKRLQAVCEGFFPDDPFIQQLRPGTGYIDRAYDLLGYADKYDANSAVVAGHVLYRATDAADARKLAGKLLAAVNTTMNPPQKLAFDQLQRVWTFAVPVYFEVRQLGLAFLRYDPSRDERFPSVYVVGRKGSGRKKASKEEAPTGPPAADGKPGNR